MQIIVEKDEDNIVTTDDEDEETPQLNAIDITYQADEIDPYTSGLSDFTFEDNVDENEVL
jgi:hypothetical protein